MSENSLALALAGGMVGLVAVMNIFLQHSQSGSIMYPPSPECLPQLVAYEKTCSTIFSGVYDVNGIPQYMVSCKSAYPACDYENVFKRIDVNTTEFFLRGFAPLVLSLAGVAVVACVDALYNQCADSFHDRTSFYHRLQRCIIRRH